MALAPENGEIQSVDLKLYSTQTCGYLSCPLQPAGRGPVVVKNLVDVLSARSRAAPRLWGSKALSAQHRLTRLQSGLSLTCVLAERVAYLVRSGVCRCGGCRSSIITKLHGIVDTIPRTVGADDITVTSQEHPACQHTTAIMIELSVAAHKNNRTSNSQPQPYS
jgi:hypothetical protein